MLSRIPLTHWFYLLLPPLILVAFLLGFSSLSPLLAPSYPFIEKLPYALLICIIALAHTLKKSQVAKIAISMLLAYWWIQERLQSPLAQGTTFAELSLLALLVPCCIFLSYCFKEADLLNKSFGVYILTLAFIAFWLYLLIEHISSLPTINSTTPLLENYPNISRLPIALVCYLAVLSIIAIGVALFYQRAIDFVWFHYSHISSVFFSAFAVIQLFYLVSSSQRLAFHDPLTGIPARNAMKSDLLKLGRRYSIAMLDIDHFKLVNDRYGHIVGDDVLKLIAKKLVTLSGGARVYRYGGEEFAIIFRGQRAKDAHDYLEFLRAAIEQYEMRTIPPPKNVSPTATKEPRSAQTTNGSFTGKEPLTKGPLAKEALKVTISIGLSDNDQLNSPNEVLAAADKALYDAKAQGRNRVVSG